jgi:CubicO group peptidase (beta-lactamase class C family)
MSKPITSVAVMILAEEGKLKLDDPVGKYLPELKSLKVHGGDDDATKNLIEPKRPMTIRDLLRHTSGLTYGFFGNSPVDKLYGQRGVLDRSTTLADMVGKLGKIPLRYQPGTKFNYSVSTDVLGRLVEVVSKKPLDEFLAARIFKPLDMKDTGFFVPESSRGRFSATHGRQSGKLRVSDAPKTSRYNTKPKLLSGGGGLVSTGRDYLRFCQMLASGGRLHDVRILKRTTVAAMTSNQLPAEAIPIGVGTGDRRDGKGFGLGFSVRVAKSDKQPAEVVGEYGWGGAASTHFWISPRHELVVITLRQFMPYESTLESRLKPIIYQAIVETAK